MTQKATMISRTILIRFRKLLLIISLTTALAFLSAQSFAQTDDTSRPELPAIIMLLLDAVEAVEEVLESLNITDPFVFLDTSEDCADYVQVYEAFVTDVGNTNDLVMDVVVTSTDTECTLTSNNIPNHDFNAIGNFATVIAEVAQTFTLVRNPLAAATPTALSQQLYNAVFLNGVPLDLLSAGCYDPESAMANDSGQVQVGCTPDANEWMLDPLFGGGGFGADEHNAHTQPDGSYHYHGNPVALFANSDYVGVPASRSPVIGFAADGFPVFGTFIDDNGVVRKATSSYVLKEDSRGVESLVDPVNPGGDHTGEYVADWEFDMVASGGDLDECNGMTVDGQYGYYVTDAYPWVMACHSGTPDDSFSKGGGGGGGGPPGM